jgi:DNA polymerase
MFNFFSETDPYNAISSLEFNAVCQQCNKCSLSLTRHHVVVGHGIMPNKLMIIGEAPGEQEDLQGKPFVGRAGQLLTKILNAVQIDREKDAYITNIVKCRPPQNRNPLEEETLACKGFLIHQIQQVKPKVLILLGSPAIKTLVKEEKKSISALRGRWIKQKVSYMNDALYIMPMFHPSYLLRNASPEKGKPKWLTWQDIKEVKAVLDHQIR